jgi:hypothetical protein
LKDVVELAKEQMDNGGIDVSKLDVGITVIVNTMNTRYKFQVKELKENNDLPLLEIKSELLNDNGGRYFKDLSLGYLVGSTWGGTCIKRSWIGQDMCMELVYKSKKKSVTTSRVQSVEIIGVGDAWRYKLWE